MKDKHEKQTLKAWLIMHHSSISHVFFFIIYKIDKMLDVVI